MLRTERLLLREWRDDDIEPCAAMCADPRVMEHFPALLDRAASEAAVARYRAHWRTEGFGLWAIEVPGIAPFIGFAGLSRPLVMRESVEVGWRLAHAYWGFGYATEAARAAVDYGFRTLGLLEIISMTVPANVKSQAVMERIGMTRDPSADVDLPHVPEGHPLRRHWIWRLRA